MQRLENILNKITLRIFAIAEQRRVERLERDRFQEKRRRWVQRCEERQRRIEKLEKDAGAWERARSLRAYLDAFEATATSKGEIDAATTNWLAWTRGYADDIDPLR